MAKKKKPNIASIMADHDKLFRSLAPGMFGKAPPMFKGRSDDKKPRRQKRRDQKRAASQPETSIIDVLSTGVMDAVSGTALAIGGALGISPEQDVPEMETRTIYLPSEKARAKAQSDASSDTTASKPTEASSNKDQSQVNSQSDAGSDDELEDFDISEPVEADLDTTDLDSEVEVDDAQSELEQPDFSAEAQVAQAAEATEASPVSGGQGYSESIASLEESRGKSVGDEVAALSQTNMGDTSAPGDDTVVGRRRARAKREKEAAARNFRRQRGENVPPPIMGIPDPTPMKGAGGGGTIGEDQSAEGVTQEENAMATNAVASAATEYARQVADLLDKVTTELAALTVRVRNMELLMDRL